MGDDDESASFEAVKADQEQRPSALIDSQTSDVGPPPAKRPFVVKRKRSRAPRRETVGSLKGARQVRGSSAEFLELCRKSRQFEASKLRFKHTARDRSRDRSEIQSLG
jgi:hypothetical protein